MNRPTLHRAAALVSIVLAACGGLSDKKIDAKAPDVPFVDQYDPPGRDEFYDGTEYCGPAVLAGIAKGHGFTDGYTDAQVVEILAGIADTDVETGTTGIGMINALQWMGMQTDAHKGADLDWIDDELAAGHDVIACGNYYAVPGREMGGRVAGHYIAISAARGGWSEYDVMDPAGREVKSLTDLELENYIESAPEGGFTISTW